MPALPSPALITANGTYTVSTFAGKKYTFAAAGNFGGGTLAILWRDAAGNTGSYAQSPATAAENWTATAATVQVDLVLTGATSPAITITFAPAEGKGVNEGELTAALADIPNFGPVSNQATRDILKAFQGLTGPRPLFVASGHNDTTQRPVLGYSLNGSNFEILPVNYVPPVGDGCRDCALLFHNEKFYLVYTAGNFGDVGYFGIATSSNLIDWVHHVNVPVPNTAGSGFTWAPEWVVDGKEIYVTYSKTHTGGIWKTHYTKANSASLLAWTDGGLVGGGSVGSEIDAQIMRFDGEWIMATRNYTSSSSTGVKIYRSTTSPVAGYVLQGTVLGDTPKEGQCLVNMGEGKLRIFFLNNPAGGGSQSFSDSFDGAITFGVITAIGGTLVVPHMTVISFLDPQVATAQVARARADVAQSAKQVGTAITQVDRAPLVDWQINGWSGVGVIPSKGACAGDLSILGGAAMIEGTAGFGRQLSLDGVDDYGSVVKSDFTKRLHDGRDFTFLIEGERLASGATTQFIMGTGTLQNNTNYGVIMYADSFAQIVIRSIALGVYSNTIAIPFTGTLVAIAFTRSVTTIRARAKNSAGLIFESVLLGASSVAEASTYNLAIGNDGLAAPGNFNPAKISRARIWDTAITPATLVP